MIRNAIIIVFEQLYWNSDVSEEASNGEGAFNREEHFYKGGNSVGADGADGYFGFSLAREVAGIGLEPGAQRAPMVARFGVVGKESEGDGEKREEGQGEQKDFVTECLHAADWDISRMGSS